MALTDAQSNAYSHYLVKGINPVAAAGIVGVLNYESKLDPLAENNSGTDAGGALNSKGAFGLAQWNGPRQKALQDFATARGLDPKALNTQLDFVLTECANSYPSVWAAIQNPTTIQAFIDLFVKTYEVPANPGPEIAGALTVAQALLATPASTTPQPPQVPVPVAPPMDPEMVVLEQVWNLVSLLDAKAQARVISYIQSRIAG